MSEKKEEGQAAAPAAPKPKPPLIVILLAVNTLAAAGAVAMLFQKMNFKRPPITEAAESEKLRKKLEKPKPVGPPGSLAFQPVTINLAAAEAGSGGANKIHYATLAFAISTVDAGAAAKLETIRPLLQDKMISMVGKRDYQDLTSVQGRYLLRTQLRELANQLAKEALVTDVYFTEFVVQ